MTGYLKSNAVSNLFLLSLCLINFAIYIVDPHVQIILLIWENLCVVLFQRRTARIEKYTRLVSHESSEVVLYGYNAASSRQGRLERIAILWCWLDPTGNWIRVYRFRS